MEVRSIASKITAATLLLSSFIAQAQTGTYTRSYPSGASCTIAVTKEQQLLQANIFAWWHTPSGQHGAFSGQGTRHNNVTTIKGTDDGTDCAITLTFDKQLLKVRFADCMTYNLPEDFSGTFHLLTNKLPGTYHITTQKAFFYKDNNSNTRSKTRAYLTKGDEVHIDIENIIDKDWVFVNFTNAAGTVTSGYLLWKEMEVR